MNIAKAIVALLLWAIGTAAAAGPTFSPAGPEAEAYGLNQGFPYGPRDKVAQQPFIVGSFSNFDRIRPSRKVARPSERMPLHEDPRPFELTYKHRGETHRIDDYLSRMPVTGFLIAQSNSILFERYQYGRNDAHRFLSQSMAKTVLAMLIGIAIEEKFIRSVDDTAEKYVPELRGFAYGATPLRALLQMSSGVAYEETYSGADDHARFGRELFAKDSKGAAAIVTQFNRRVAPAGTRFSYAGIESEILGIVLRRATGMPVADYLASRIWQPMGAEADASWIVDGAGDEATYGYFNAVLRDYARFALLLAHDGSLAGRAIIPRHWIAAATTVAPGDEHLSPGKATPYYGYGYQVWLLPGRRRMFALLGVHGQAIFVDPESKLVLVQTAVRLKPSNDPSAAELVSLWLSLVRTNRR